MRDAVSAMSRSNSYLEESGVWCPDEESGDNLSSVVVSTSTSTARAKAKHSGGSVDASGDVEIVDIKDSEWQSYHSYCSTRRSKKTNNRRHKEGDECKKTKHSSTSSFRGHSSTPKRRTSSFSKVFGCNGKFRSDVFGRRASFRIKSISKRRSHQADDDGISWPDPIVFKRESKLSTDTESEGVRLGSPAEACPSISSSRNNGRLRNHHRRKAGSERGYLNNNTFTRSTIFSRPSLTSSTIKESAIYQQYGDRSRDETFVYLGEKKSHSVIPAASVNEEGLKKQSPSIEKVVESINVRNFADKSDERSLKRRTFQLFAVNLHWYFFISVFSLLLSLVLLSLMIWQIQSIAHATIELQEIRNLIHRRTVAGEEADGGGSPYNESWDGFLV